MVVRVPCTFCGHHRLCIQPELTDGTFVNVCEPCVDGFTATFLAARPAARAPKAKKARTRA